jgi:hypothetical protein
MASGAPLRFLRGNAKLAPFDPAKDLAELSTAIERFWRRRLVIIDPTAMVTKYSCPTGTTYRRRSLCEIAAD